MDTRKRLASLLYDQERRGELDDMSNDWLQGKFSQKKVDRSGIFDNVPGYDMLRRWFGVSVR